jgi:dTDP-4-dehydrorhamnose reductase
MILEKILIIGANGFLGRKLLNRFHDKFDVYGADLITTGIPEEYHPNFIDITKKSVVHDLINNIMPNLTILTAAMTNVDACEDFPNKAREINAHGPLFVAEAMKEIGGRLIHISTDFIFDGEKGGYDEKDIPKPVSIYGKTKLDGENNVLMQKIPTLICRTSVLFGWPDVDQRHNFFSWAYENLSQNKELKIISGQITTPTLVDDLVEFLYQSSDFTKTEIYHTCGCESISRFDFILKLIRNFNFNENLLKEVDFFPQKAKRPNDSSLNTAKIQYLGKYKFKNIDQSFQYLKAQSKNSNLNNKITKSKML